MKNKFLITIGSLGLGVMLLAGISAPAFAQVSTSTHHSININLNATSTASIQNGDPNSTTTIALQVHLANIRTRAGLEITRRITALNALNAKIATLQKVSSQDKATLSASVQAQITEMTTLQNKITVDDTTTTLALDVKSITDSYRIFILVIPQGAVEIASDRVLWVVSLMNTLGNAFSTRISAAQGAGANVTAVQATYDDYISKINDANSQSQAATAETIGLTPDNGVQAQMQANTAAIKDAAVKIRASQSDLIVARADADVIIKALKSFEASGKSGISATVTASSSDSSSSQ